MQDCPLVQAPSRLTTGTITPNKSRLVDGNCLGMIYFGELQYDFSCGAKLHT